MSQHAVLSPSGAETWMNCPGSAAMQRGLVDTPSEYSDEGTAAHLLGSTCLEKGVDADTYLNCKIEVGSDGEFDGALWFSDPKPEGFKVRRKYTVDQDMADHVQKYVDRIREYQGDGQVFPEMRVSITHITGEEGAAGTSDAPVVRGRELQVHDLKYGMGVRVDAKHNKQLMIYADGVREELDLVYGPFDRIRFVIHQPRLDHVSEWDCTPEELAKFIEEEAKPAAWKALHFYHMPEMPPLPTRDLIPSEDACRWCKAKPHCPALKQYVQDMTALDFEAEEPVIEMPATGFFDPADLARHMAAIPLIEDWCKSVRAEVERQLFAGKVVPGWKVVQGKKGNRQWSDVDAAEALLKQMRLKVEERCDLKLKSPPAIEKLLKAEPKRWNRVLKAGLIVQKDGQPSVAPESDKRPVWTPPATEDDFTATEEEESIV